MKTIPIFATAALATGLLALGARAQSDQQPATIAAPSREAAPPPAPVRPAPDRIIYVPRLPSATELTNVAGAQGLAIDQIDQTSADVTVIYKYSNGQTNTVQYKLLPASGSVTGQVVVPATTPPPAVVYYTPAPRYYYSYYDPFYSPWPWYGPVAVSLGFGFGYHHGYYGGHYGGYHGGFHHR